MNCRVRNNPGPRSEPYLRFPHHQSADRLQTDWPGIRSDDCTLRCSTDRFCRIQTQKITEIIKYSNQERGCVRRCSAASLFANFASKLVR